MKRSVLAVVMAGVLVLASPNPAWAYNRDFENFRITSVPDGKMRVRAQVLVRASEGGPDDCAQDVPIRVQIRAGGRWVTRKKARTDQAARLDTVLKRRRGRYRLVAIEFTTPAGNQCYKAVSQTMQY